MDLSFNPLLAFAWCVLAGFLMSSGAGGGGILAGVGHISILGIGDANMIKVVNQILEFSSRLVSVPLYHRQKRLVWSLALTFGIGAPVGAAAGSWFSKTYLSDMSAYRQAFGVLVTLVAARVLYEGWAKAVLRHAGFRKAQEASDRVQRSVRIAGANGLAAADGRGPSGSAGGRARSDSRASTSISTRWPRWRAVSRSPSSARRSGWAAASSSRRSW